ncbi:hypothetical protein HK405_006688, partial [Cladochytrium tenue]
LNITNSVELQLVMSVFILAYSVGPLFMAPLSELYGRVIVLQLANLVYLVFNLLCAFAPSPATIIVFRFIAGLGGSAPLAVGGGVLTDLFQSDERGVALAMYTIAPMIGPATGTLMAGFLVSALPWRWLFYVTSAFDGLVQLAGLFFLAETYAPVLLQRRRRRRELERRAAAGETGVDAAADANHKISLNHAAAKIKEAAVRPFVLLLTQPIIQVLSLYMMFLYGIMYLSIATFSDLFTGPTYSEPVGVSGLNYIALAVGQVLGSQIAGTSSDRTYRHLRDTRGAGTGRPEFRLPMVVPGAIIMPAGLLLYGWAAERAMPWPVPDAGMLLFATGLMTAYMCVNVYVFDCYQRYAASAVAAVTFLRSLGGFGFPLFAPTLYEALGYGWGNSVLALVGFAVGVPAPFLLWRFGPALRSRSTYAAG